MKWNLLAICFLLLAACEDPPIVISGKEGRKLPDFNARLVNIGPRTDTIHTGDIPGGRPIVCLFLSPYCPFCRAETQKLIDNIETIDSFNVYIFSNFPFESIEKYYREFHLNNYSNITVAQDFSDGFQHFYNPPGVPYIVVFDRNKKLRQALIGVVEPKQFARALR